MKTTSANSPSRLGSTQKQDYTSFYKMVIGVYVWIFANNKTRLQKNSFSAKIRNINRTILVPILSLTLPSLLIVYLENIAMDSQPPESDTDGNVQTGGGAYIGGSVYTSGDFVGRDKIIKIGYTADEVERLFTKLRPDGPPHQEFVRKSFEPETIIIAAGTFIMGRAPGPSVPSEETPPHSVTLPAYRIGKTLISNRRYAEFVDQTGRLLSPAALWNGQNPPHNQLDTPVTGLTFFDALAYCEWLSKQTGRNYSLPNEAQWEKAAGSALNQGFVWGDAPEWTCTLWGEKLRSPDPHYFYPWQDDGRNDVNAGAHLRRVVRGTAAALTARSNTMPDQPGAPGRRHGFRIILVL